MSGFSAELIDYLEGRITFEEFDRRREEREAAVSGSDGSGSEPHGNMTYEVTSGGGLLLPATQCQGSR